MRLLKSIVPYDFSLFHKIDESVNKHFCMYAEILKV